MASLTRILPRDWDGRRLLRFLTGLALIALSFTVHLGVGADPATHRPAGVAAPAAILHPVDEDPVAPDPVASHPVDQDPVASHPVDQDRVAPGSVDQDRVDAPRVADVAADRSAAPAAAGQLAGAALTALLPAVVLPRVDAGAVLPAGTAPGVPGSRAPPRA